MYFCVYSVYSCVVCTRCPPPPELLTLSGPLSGAQQTQTEIAAAPTLYRAVKSTLIYGLVTSSLLRCLFVCVWYQSMEVCVCGREREVVGGEVRQWDCAITRRHCLSMRTNSKHVGPIFGCELATI